MDTNDRLDLTFLGSGNAFGNEGRAFSSFLMEGRILFDCGPTVLQQLKKARLRSANVEAVVISHFHGDHFFGLPFLLLDAWHEGRTAGIEIVGPPGVGQRTEQLLDLAFPHIAERMSFERRYTEMRDGAKGKVLGMHYEVAEVEHVPSLQCFAYRFEVCGKALVYSGDSRLCEGLLRIARGADVLVLECSCAGEVVHLSPSDVAQVVAAAGPKVQAIVTHLDAAGEREAFRGLHVASDLCHFSF